MAKELTETSALKKKQQTLDWGGFNPRFMGQTKFLTKDEDSLTRILLDSTHKSRLHS